MRTGITIDGGGILGIGSARFLKELNYCGEDFLAGTSVGAILVAMRGSGMSWERVYNIFRSEGSAIFENPGFFWNMNPQKPKYDNKNLIALLKKYLGDVKMCDLHIPCFITTSDFKSGKPKVFDRTDDIMVRDAVLMSTAAPTFFPPVGQCADGGLWANNPCMVGVGAYSKMASVEIDQIRVLSIGTGSDFYHSIDISPSMNKLQWAPKLIDFMMFCTEDAMSFLAEQFMGNRFFRVEPHSSKRYELDDVSLMDEYEMLWYKHWLAHKNEITKWLNK